MKNWPTPLRRTLVLAASALLTFVGYIFLAALVLGEWNLSAGLAAIGTVVVVALTGVWLWALLSIARGGRGGLIAVLILGLLNILAGASDILVFCPTPCQGFWPLAEIWHWVMVLSGLAAAITAGVQLKQGSSRFQEQ